MRLRFDQLQNQLSRQQLAPIYFVTGDEPLQMLEAADWIRQAAREQGCEERTVLNVDKSFDWNQLLQESASMSLFASRRLIELRMSGQKPGREGAATLSEYATQAEFNDVLLITTDRVDRKTQQTKWFKTLEKVATVVQIWPVEVARLPEWIQGRARDQGKQMDRDAASLVANKVEGNLLAARQEIDKLVLLVTGETISLADVMESVSDSARFEVFDLVESAMSGQRERIARMIRGLKVEGAEPIAIFGALMWEFRRVCMMSSEISGGMAKEKVFEKHRLFQQRKFATNSVLKRYSDKQLHQILRQAVVVDKVMKGAIRADNWDVLENFLFRLAGVRLQSLPVS